MTAGSELQPSHPEEISEERFNYEAWLRITHPNLKAGDDYIYRRKAPPTAGSRAPIISEEVRIQGVQEIRGADGDKDSYRIVTVTYLDQQDDPDLLVGDLRIDSRTFVLDDNTRQDLTKQWPAEWVRIGYFLAKPEEKPEA